MIFNIHLAIFVLITVGCNCANNATRDYYMDLIEHLKTIRIDPNAPPMLNISQLYSERLPIYFTFILSNLKSLDGAKQEIVMSAYFTMTWEDERLVWNASAFGGVNSVVRDSNTVWYPRIVMYNGVGDKQEILPPSKIQFSHVTNQLSYAQAVQRREFSAGCTFDVRHFPNDVQTCEFEFYSMDQWTKPMLDIQNISILSLYNPSNEWNLVEAVAGIKIKNVNFVQDQPPHKINLYSCKVVYRRVYAYYMMNVIVPIVLLSFLQTLVFFVPTESGEKMSLGITILLSFTVFLLLLDNIIPKSLNLPVISTFITASMCLSAISLFLTSLILRLYHTPIERKMPNLVHLLLVRGLARAMFVYVEPAGTSVNYKKRPTSPVQISPVELESREKNSYKINKLEFPNSNSSNEPVQEQNNSSPINLWIVAAIGLERLMLILGFVIMIVMVFVLVLPTFM